ncbi:MAG: hypothetical protein EBR30_19715 [Cytophagia bacterium]|nr:hypothetical protein [Cytophagia bacterium]
MKKILYTLLWFVCLQTVITACKEDDPQLDPAPSAADVRFTFEYDAVNPNIVRFTNTSAIGFKPIWDFGNGITSTENQVTVPYPVEGNYNVKLTLLTAGGIANSTQVVNIAETNPLMLDIPSYNMLTGGVNAANGKTWIIDKETQAHLGVGPIEGTTPEWFAAAPLSKDNRNFYDDEMTFKLSGFTYEHVVNGLVYANAGYGTLPGAVLEPGGPDYFLPWTPQPSKWSLTDNADGTYQLTLTNPEFIGYYHGATSYKVLSLTNDEMHIRSIDPNGGGNCCAWYQRLIRKGFTRPVTPPEPPEYKIEDIEDNFQGTSTVTYTNDAGGSLTRNYDNPAPVGVNTSSKVAMYVKANGAASQFANVQIRLNYKMDITTRNKFKLKVFIPSFNDYVTQGGEPWQSYNTLQKQVALKLQNRDLGGNAFTTQAEVKFTNLETNKWIELEFDFSAFSSRTDFDQIVIQLGGEAIHTGGIFFIDDLELL